MREEKERNQLLSRTFHETYSELVGNLMPDAEYDVILLERAGSDGLSKEDIFRLLAFLSPDKEYYPAEFPAHHVESCAMGFISSEAAEALDYEYDSDSVLRQFVAGIMDDMEKEMPDHVYEFLDPNGKKLKIYLDR